MRLPAPLQKWRRGVLPGAAAVLLLAVVSCASLPAREPTTTPVPPAQLAGAVTVHGRDGPLNAAAESRVLAALKAEGHGDLTARHLGVLAARGEVDLYRGNAARLLVDGPATFRAMKAAIETAHSRILLESYIVDDSGIAAEFGALLLRKAAQGVSVALMYDSLGSMATAPAFFASLAAGGVAVCAFNPVNPLQRPGYWGINHRDHRKVLVVDNAMAFAGGINISRVYSSGSFGGRARRAAADVLSDGWRDTQIELKGPVVAALAATFSDAWLSQGCRGELRAAPPAAAAPGQRLVKVIASDPRDAENRIYTSLLAAVDASQRSVHLTMAYFAPGPDMIEALCDAARRGAEVMLVLPGRSDFSLLLHAGRSYYTQLLEAGVRVFEMENAVMHAKTAVIDGVFSTVGSSNMDWRSFVANSEINVVVLGDDFGHDLEALFRHDLTVSHEIAAPQWQQRGLRQRLLEQLGRAAERLL